MKQIAMPVIAAVAFIGGLMSSKHILPDNQITRLAQEDFARQKSVELSVMLPSSSKLTIGASDLKILLANPNITFEEFARAKAVVPENGVLRGSYFRTYDLFAITSDNFKTLTGIVQSATNVPDLSNTSEQRAK